MQTYGSALVFTPSISEIRNSQWKERLSFIRNVKGIRDRWSALQQTLEGHGRLVKSVAFSPDGTTLALASNDRTVWLWDSATGAHKQTLEGHGNLVSSVAFSPNGTTLASASDDRTVRLWDYATGAHKQTFDVGRIIQRLSFCSDESYLDTDLGVLDITDRFTIHSPPSTTLPLFVRDQWIVCGSDTPLWLPPDYRATSVAVFKDLIELGHGSGGVSIIELVIIRSKDGSASLPITFSGL